MSNDKTFVITAFVGAILLMAMFGVKALLYAPLFLIAGLIMMALKPKNK